LAVGVCSLLSDKEDMQDAKDLDSHMYLMLLQIAVNNMRRYLYVMVQSCRKNESIT
jgi:hypothetical protein